MAHAKNKVISGWGVGKVAGGKYIAGIPATKQYIESYEIVTEDKVKSKSSAFMLGATGTALFGGFGAPLGLISKDKSIYTIAIHWKDGHHSLIEIADYCYKDFIKNNFY